MKCNVCGREIPYGQMFCQCGNTVNAAPSGNRGITYNYDNYESDALNVNKPSGNKIMIIAIIAGILTFVLLIAVFFTAAVNASNSITDPTKWETVTTANYQMTRPADMKKIDLNMQTEANVTDLGTYRKGKIILNMGMYQFTAEQKKYFKRKKVAEQLKDMLPSVMPNNAVPQERGNMVYIETVMEQSGVFFGTDQVEYVSAYYVSNNGMYVVQLITPASSYGKYKDSIFSWLDSFRPN